MSDPYKVLGVSSNASEDEIKAAYRELAKKYHPDNYANNPLADLAAEKMKEINEAYDAVVRHKNTGGAGAGGSSGGGSYGGGAQQGGYDPGYAGQTGGKYQNIREFINQNRVAEAQSLLEHIPAGQRDAEWYFLRGCVFYKSGWVNEAYTHFQTATRMDPQNDEYTRAFRQLSWQMNNRGFGSNFGGYQGGNAQGCNGCDLCTSLMCMDCLCSGMGGGC